MLRKKPGIEYFIRVIMIIAAAMGQIYLRQDSGLPFFIICLLVFILSSQIRIIFLKNRFFIASIFIELAIVYYMNITFGGFVCLLLLISMSDSLLSLETEKWFISAITAGLLVFFLWGKDAVMIVPASAIFILVFILCVQIRKLRDEIQGLETLYDENRNYSYQMESAKERLEEYSKRVEQLSQQDERNRISRELHDTVGHRLTGVLMQLDAAIKVCHADVEAGRRMFGSVRDNLSDCIDLLRDTVKNIQTSYEGRVLSIQQMAADFGRSTGTNIDFKITGSPYKLYPSAEITLLRNAQEALTNAVRHGKANNVAIELAYSGREVVLTVQDDGLGCSNINKGMGLSGMEERLALLGGILDISSENGFKIKTIIPVN